MVGDCIIAGDRPNDGVLLLAHGSRAKETQDTLNAVADMVRAKCPGRAIEVAYMEFCDVNIEKGLGALKDRGVTNVKVVPYFLFDGIHIREDIPEELAKFVEKNPDMTVTLGKTLGADERLADIVADRIAE